ncbi:MAG: PP0621 family protein [Gallionella sp.]|nr:PP0621 family protein [Gallionella sp.]
MARLLMLVAIVVAVYLLIRSYRSKASAREESVLAEDMVCCAHCGVHLPKGESVQSDGAFYCSASHRDADRD